MNGLEIIFWLATFLVVYSYVLYPIILIILKKIFPAEYRPPFSNSLPNVSIIIAAYNEEKMIQERIENCLNLDYPKHLLETIIISDGSTDKTDEIVNGFSSHGVVLVRGERAGKVNALNRNVPKAKGEIVVFSDANTMFDHDALMKLVRHFSDSTVGCVCGRLIFVSPQGSRSGELEGVYWKYETFLKKMEGARGSLLGANGAIYALRKELFFQCPPDTIVEDFVVPMKILEAGYKVVYDPEAHAFEETTQYVAQEKERRIRIGAGDFQALIMLRGMLNPLRGFPALAFWSHKVLRWLAPFFLIIMFFVNIALLFEPFYRIIFVAQLMFYGSAFVGKMLNWSGIRIKFFNLCYYFLSMNLALFLGFCKFLTGTQKVTWVRTER